MTSSQGHQTEDCLDEGNMNSIWMLKVGGYGPFLT